MQSPDPHEESLGRCDANTPGWLCKHWVTSTSPDIYHGRSSNVLEPCQLPTFALITTRQSGRGCCTFLKSPGHSPNRLGARAHDVAPWNSSYVSKIVRTESPLLKVDRPGLPTLNLTCIFVNLLASVYRVSHTFRERMS